MSYESEITAIVSRFADLVTGTAKFNKVISGFKSATEDVKDMPVAFVVLRTDSLKAQMGAVAENRTTEIEVYTLNNVSQAKAIELSGAVVDAIETDPTLASAVAWLKNDRVEFYVNVLKGFDLNWSRVVYSLERRRIRNG